MTSVTFSPNGEFVASGSYDDPELPLHPLITQARFGSIESAERELKSMRDRGETAFYKPWRADGKVVIMCVPEKEMFRSRGQTKIRARVISSGYCESVNVQFPRDIRQSGKCFVVDGVEFVGHCYSVRGDIREETAQDRLAAMAKNKVRVWSVSEGTCQELSGHSGWVRSVSFSPDGKFVASCSDDKTVRMWSASEGTCLKVITGHR